MKYEVFEALVKSEAILKSEYKRHRASNFQQAEAALAAQHAIAAYREGRYTCVPLIRDPDTEKLH